MQMRIRDTADFTKSYSDAEMLRKDATTAELLVREIVSSPDLQTALFAQLEASTGDRLVKIQHFIDLVQYTQE